MPSWMQGLLLLKAVAQQAIQHNQVYRDFFLVGSVSSTRARQYGRECHFSVAGDELWQNVHSDT